MTVLYHKRRTVHSIFQIRISRNTKCADKTSFPRRGHKYKIHTFAWHHTVLQEFSFADWRFFSYLKIISLRLNSIFTVICLILDTQDKLLSKYSSYLCMLRWPAESVWKHVSEGYWLKFVVKILLQNKTK